MKPPFNPMNMLDAAKNWLQTNFSRDIDAPRFLKHSAAVGWILVCVANCFGIVKNPDIKTKEKKFLIPQELADGTVNIGLYYILTGTLIKQAEKLVDKGKIVFDGAAGGSGAFKAARAGVGVAAALAGAVISSNIITPIVRNIFAADRQKKYLESLKAPPLSPAARIISKNMNSTPALNSMDKFMTLNNQYSGSLRI